MDTELEALLDQWEQAAKAGVSVTVESLCKDRPEREADLRAAIAALQAGQERLASAPPRRKRSSRSGDPLDGHAVTISSRIDDLQFHARGGLGCVFHAVDGELGRDVAVKVVAPERQHSAEAKQRFLREAEVTGRLRHPGIVPVYSQGETVEGRPFYVMPFLDEGTLEDAIQSFHEENTRYRTEHRLFRDLLARFIAACKTVAYAHSRGVVHCDLKPHNIMLGRYGETLVIDWGLAEKTERAEQHRLTGEQSLILRGGSSSSGGFTPQYASPEQMDGSSEVGPPSDIYSLGAVLYRLLTGSTPVAATTMGELRRACLNGDIEPARERHRSVPGALSAVCRKAMQVNPADRYDSPESLAADVEAFLADAPVSAESEGYVRKLARFVRREWSAAIVLMAALLVLSAVGLGTALQQGVLKSAARDSSRSRLQLAATLAAQVCGGEIDRRWRMLEIESSTQVVRELVGQLNDDPDAPGRMEELQAYMTDKYVHARDVEGLKFVSLLVQGIDGRILSRVPRAEQIGDSFAYRDYFHGEGKDLSIHAKPPPARRVVLSTVFVSVTTGKPHVAMSVPILEAAPESGAPKVIGRMAMTIYIGDLGMFDYLGDEEVPMLVETRRYNWGTQDSFGVVVHHPNASLKGWQKESKGRVSRVPAVKPEVLATMLDRWEQAPPGAKALDVSEFVDPITGNIAEAAFAPVVIGGRPLKDRDTGWFIILRARNADS